MFSIKPLIFVPLLTLAMPLHAAPIACSAQQKEVQLEKRTGSASLVSNTIGTKDSIGSQLKAMLDNAQKSYTKTKPPTLRCGDGCVAEVSPQIIFSAVPRKFLTSYEGQASCDRYLKETYAQPIVYGEESYPNFKKLSDSFSSLARGSGSNGKDLYKRCDGMCSPRYSLHITVKKEGGYVSKPFITCGPARDKNDGMYDLITTLRWVCRKK